MSDLLRFEDVALRRGGRLLFEGLSFTLRAGHGLRVEGPNGSGKSSLLRLAAGLLRAERGEVRRTPAALADDHPALDRELPLGRALAFWGGSTGPAMDALAIAALSEVPVRLLSAGQLKRAALARVASSGHALWLLDEPLNALDDDGCERLTKLLERHRAGGGAVLLASHRALPGDWAQLELAR